MNPPDYGRVVETLASRARRLIRSRLTRMPAARRKADRSPVTAIDLAVERELRQAIRRAFPGHGIIGEEWPAHLPEAEYQWLIDPIDGTRSLLHGVPFFGTIIGLHHRGRPVAGVIDFPVTGDRYLAVRGGGAWHNGRRLRLRDARPADLPEEIVSATGRAHFAALGAARGFDRLQRLHPQVRGYADCIAHAWAAAGLIGAVADFGVRRWDIAATPLLVEEAGGRYVIVRQRGSGNDATFGIVAGKPRVVAMVERLLG